MKMQLIECSGTPLRIASSKEVWVVMMLLNLYGGKTSTYNLAFFLGPGFPRGFGRPSGVNATPELLLTPFFLGPSVGGGIDDVGAGVPLAAGVLDAE